MVRPRWYTEGLGSELDLIAGAGGGAARLARGEEKQPTFRQEVAKEDAVQKQAKEMAEALPKDVDVISTTPTGDDPLTNEQAIAINLREEDADDPPIQPTDVGTGDTAFDTAYRESADTTTTITRTNVDEFLSSLGGAVRKEFETAWSPDAKPDWSMQPMNLNEAQHQEAWLRTHNPRIVIDNQRGTITFRGTKLEVGGAIPEGLEEVLSFSIGAVAPGARGDFPRGGAQMTLTVDDLVAIRREQETYDWQTEWTGSMINMALDSQKTAWQTDIETAGQQQLEDLQRQFLTQQAEVTSRYNQELEEVRAAESRKAERVRGEETRASLTHEFTLRQTELEDEYNRAKGIAEQDRITMLERINVQMEAEKALLDRRYELDLDLREAELEFQSEQAGLDRALEMREIDEAVRHNQNLEILDAQRNALAKDQLKVDMVTQIANNPAFLFYAKSSGMLDILADALGGTDSANEMYDALVSFVPKDMSQLNIQEFNRLSSMEQSLQQFATSASQGLSTSQQHQQMIAGAPLDPRRQTRFTKPTIRPGRGADPSLFDFSSEEALDVMEPVGGTAVRREGSTASTMLSRLIPPDEQPVETLTKSYPRLQ